MRMPYLAMGLGAKLNLNNIAALFWETTELAINIICTSVATWKPLFVKNRELSQPATHRPSRSKTPMVVPIEDRSPHGPYDLSSYSSRPISL